MKIKFVMFPAESGLQEVYERINALEEERARARLIRSLLSAVASGAGLPVWFTSLPRKPFGNHRAKTVRLSLDERDPALAPLMQAIGNAEHAAALIRIKDLLLQACPPSSSTACAASPPSPTSGALVLIDGSQPKTLAFAQPAKPEVMDEEARQAVLRKAARVFL